MIKSQTPKFRNLNILTSKQKVLNLIGGHLASAIGILNLFLPFYANAASEVITVHFFYSPSCGHCMDILLGDIPLLQRVYKFNLKKYDLNNLDNYKLLEQMEKEKNIQNIGEDLPIVFVGDSAFYGPEAVKEKLGLFLKRYAERKIPPVKRDTVAVKQDTLKKTTKEVNLYYFYQPSCPECNRAEALLNGLKEKYPDMVIHRYNIFDAKSKILYEGLADLTKIPEARRLIVPAIFIGEDFIIRDIAADKLEGLLQKYSGGSPRLDTLKFTAAEEGIVERFKKFSILGIMLAGLIDGVNPCAFATIIFFISYLIFIGQKKKSIIAMAVSFISAVFLCYLAIGFGAYTIINMLSAIKFLRRIIFLSFGIFALILGILSLYDYFVARRGDFNRMILQLPLIIKQRIHKEIKEKTGVGGIIIGSFIAGGLISFLEFGCTGQVYLPTITFVVSRAALGLKPVILLIIYNIMFIFPLIIIAVLTSLISRENVADALSRRIPLIKLLTALLFFGLGILLIIS